MRIFQFSNKNSIDWQLTDKETPMRLLRNKASLVSCECGKVVRTRITPNPLPYSGGTAVLFFTGEIILNFSNNTSQTLLCEFKHNNIPISPTSIIDKEDGEQILLHEKFNFTLSQGHITIGDLTISIQEMFKNNKLEFNGYWDAYQLPKPKSQTGYSYSIEDITRPQAKYNDTNAIISFCIMKNIYYDNNTYTTQIYKQKVNEKISFEPNDTYEPISRYGNNVYMENNTPLLNSDGSEVSYSYIVDLEAKPKPYRLIYGYIQSDTQINANNVTEAMITDAMVNCTAIQLSERPTQNLIVEAPLGHSFVFILVNENEKAEYFDMFEDYEFESFEQENKSSNGNFNLTINDTTFTLYGRYVYYQYKKYQEEIIFKVKNK